MKLTTRPLTPDLWPAFEDLFGENGAVGGCWCLYWRIGRAYRKKPREENRTAFREIVERGPPPQPAPESHLLRAGPAAPRSQHYYRINFRRRSPLPLHDAGRLWPARSPARHPAGARRMAPAHAGAPR